MFWAKEGAWSLLCGGKTPEDEVLACPSESGSLLGPCGWGSRGICADNAKTAVPLQGVPLSAYLSPQDRQTPGGRNLTPDVPSESSPKLHQLLSKKGGQEAKGT